MWASFQQIADLFETDKFGISRHIRNIYQTKDLDEKSTVTKIATVQMEGSRKVERLIDLLTKKLLDHNSFSSK